MIEVFTDFSPYLFNHLKDKDIVEVDNFGEAVDKYFGSITVKKT